MPEQHIPTIIRLQEEWAKQRILGPPPVWDGDQDNILTYGVFGGPWPWWKRILYRLTGSLVWLPEPLDFHSR